MIVTLGDLVSELLNRFEHRLHDHELAAIATQVAVTEAVAASAARARPHEEKRSWSGSSPSR